MLLRDRYPEDAAAMAKSILGNESDRLERGISAKLSPYSPATALAAYWMARMEGRAEDALAILRDAKAGGVPIPIEIP
jgi:hypothetical protein